MDQHQHQLTNSLIENKNNELQIKQITNDQLNNQLIQLAQRERKITHEILLHINEVESRRLFAQMGFGSTLEYLVKTCQYSERAAYRRIQAARFIKSSPDVSEKLKQGTVNLTQVARVQTIIKKQESETGFKLDQEKKENLIEKIENQNSYNTDLIIAKELNLKIEEQEKIKIQQDESIYLSLKLSKIQNQKLNQIKNLISHINPNPTMAELVEYLSDFYLNKKVKIDRSLDNQEIESDCNVNKQKIKVDLDRDKQKGTESDSDKNNKSGDHLSKTAKYNVMQKRCADKNQQANKDNFVRHKQTLTRNYISLKTKEYLKQKSGYRCEYQDHKTGRRCSSQHQLEIDHMHPRAKGGTDDIQNLRVLCKQHNLLMVEQWFGC